MPTALSFRDVSKSYVGASGQTLHALDHVSFDIPSGRRVAVIGRSGSGKSTLLHLSAGIDVPSSGEVLLHDKGLAKLSEDERTRLRRKDVGLIFQFFHLLPQLSVYDNIALPWMIAGGPDPGTRIAQLLERVGLANRAGDPVQKLSGGEMQRVAICRALLPKPQLLLADEPTGNLDDDNSRRVMDLLLALCAEERATLLFVTHSRELAALADETWSLQSGRLQ